MMFYLQPRGKSAQPNLAEAPYICNADGLHEWSYAQEKHKAALKNVKGLIDQSPPRSLDPSAQRIQAHTRRFCEDQKRAEIGRENRKMVERLQMISRGGEMVHGGDPRSPPPSMGMRSHSQPSLSLATTSSYPDKVRSLNEPLRRKNQKEILDGNASLVRRILHAKGEFDAKADRRDFKRHLKAGANLRRIPSKEKDGSRSRHHSLGGSASAGSLSSPLRPLPPMRPRVMNFSAPLQGLGALFIPGELMPLGAPMPVRERTSRPPAEPRRSPRSGGSRSASGSRSPRSPRSARSGGSRSPRSARSGSRSRSRSGSRTPDRSRTPSPSQGAQDGGGGGGLPTSKSAASRGYSDRFDNDSQASRSLSPKGPGGGGGL